MAKEYGVKCQGERLTANRSESRVLVGGIENSLTTTMMIRIVVDWEVDIAVPVSRPPGTGGDDTGELELDECSELFN